MTITLTVWLAIVLVLSFTASSAKDFAANSSGAGLPDDAPSVIADKELEEQFENSDVMPAILVFHQESGFDEESLSAVGSSVESLHDLPAEVTDGMKAVLPFNQMDTKAQKSFLSDDETTLVFPVHLKEGLEMDTVNDMVVDMEEAMQESLPETIDVAVTGPAGIASDALELFSNGDMVLLFSTIGLILVLLVVIYRSPLLALIPLLASGIVYEVVNRTIGIAGENNWFSIDSQSLSIMMILLFAAITDYSLFIFSRFREELWEVESKYEAMQRAMSQVGRPIFFSGGTVLVAVLTLAAAVFEPYRHFAPVFSVAMVIILLAGLTLVPALFTLFGRRAFWPSIPRAGEETKVKTNTIWNRISQEVTKKPLVTGGSVLVVLLVLSANAAQIGYSYNLLQSFPEDMTSREGFELIESKYNPGEVAPTTVLVTSENTIEKDNVDKTGI